jgi:hypothetical protein
MQVPESVQAALENSLVTSPGPHQLSHAWSFSFCHRPPGVKGSANNYADQMKVIASFDTVRMPIFCLCFTSFCYKMIKI